MCLKKFKFASVIVLSALLFSSCLDIVEDIFIKEDGSGTYTLTLTANESLKGMMARSMENQDDEEEEEDNFLAGAANTGDFKDNFKAIGESLKALDGVNNFESFSDEENMKFGYSFDFDKVETLNKCMEISAGEHLAKMPKPQGKGKKEFVPTARYIEWNGNTLVRHHNAELDKAKNMKKNDGRNAGMMGGIDVTYIFQDMRIVSNYEFDRAFKGHDNDAAIITKGNTHLSLECLPFMPISTDEKLQKLRDEGCRQAVSISFK